MDLCKTYVKFPLVGEGHRDGGAHAYGAFQMNLGAVMLRHMLDNGETQAGAAGGPAVAFVHPVKALKDAVLVLRRDADAGVGDTNAVLREENADGAVGPVVANGVVNEIVNQLSKLPLVSVDGAFRPLNGEGDSVFLGGGDQRVHAFRGEIAKIHRDHGCRGVVFVQLGQTDDVAD